MGGHKSKPVREPYEPPKKREYVPPSCNYLVVSTEGTSRCPNTAICSFNNMDSCINCVLKKPYLNERKSSYSMCSCGNNIYSKIKIHTKDNYANGFITCDKCFYGKHIAGYDFGDVIIKCEQAHGHTKCNNMAAIYNHSSKKWFCWACHKDLPQHVAYKSILSNCFFCGDNHVTSFIRESLSNVCSKCLKSMVKGDEQDISIVDYTPRPSAPPKEAFGSMGNPPPYKPPDE